MRTLWLIAFVVAAVHSAQPPHGRNRLADDHPQKQHDHLLGKRIAHVHDVQPTFLGHYLRPKRSPHRNWVVVFYTSWCNVCDELVDPLGAAAGAFDEQKTTLSFAKIDVTEDQGVAHKYGIDAYPAVVLFPKSDDEKHVVYEGAREAEGLLKWIFAETGLGAELKK